MRIAFVALLGLVACGGSSTRAGIYLQLQGSGTADSVEVLIADAPTMIPQRTSDAAGETPIEVNIPYYVQRATTGRIAGPIDLDGYMLLIEPGVAADLTSLVPIVVARTGSGSDESIAAVGVVVGADGSDAVPTADPLVFDATKAEVADVPMVGIAAAVAAGRTVAGELTAYACTDGSPSGYVWRDHANRELRLVVPAAGSSDATSRGLDVDCDQSVAPTDCDDLRADINPAQAQVCDGVDHDCAMDRSVTLLPCTCNGVAGHELCDQANPGPATCENPACPGSGPFVVCSTGLTSSGGNGLRLCSPASGLFPTPAVCVSAGCTIRVAAASSGLSAQLSLQPKSGFDTEVDYAHGDVLYLQVDSSLLVTSTPTAPVGQIDLVVTDPAGTPSYVGVEIGVGSGLDCVQSGSDASTLSCLAAVATPQ